MTHEDEILGHGADVIGARAGQALRALRVSKSVAQEQIARMLQVTREHVAEWERGGTRPSRAELVRYAQALGLSGAQTRALLASFDGAAPPDEVPQPSTGPEPDGVTAHSNTTATSLGAPQIDREIQTLLTDLQAALKDVVSWTDSAGISPDVARGVRDELSDALSTTSQLRHSSHQLSARIIPPPPEDLEVRLVALESFRRLQEYRSEETKWIGAASVSLGAILGIVINVSTGGHWTASSGALAITFAAFTALTAWTATVYARRAQQLQSELTDRGRSVGADHR